MKTLYIRKRNVIKTIADGKTERFGSVALAKKQSHKLQMANGGLGRGSLLVDQ